MNNGIKRYCPSICEFSVGPNFSVIVICVGKHEWWSIDARDGELLKHSDPSEIAHGDLWPEAIDICNQLQVHEPI
jgi:hypothetical protein